jgi:hypothetical protein
VRRGFIVLANSLKLYPFLAGRAEHGPAWQCANIERWICRAVHHPVSLCGRLIRRSPLLGLPIVSLPRERWRLMEGVGVRREETRAVPHGERTDHGNEAAGEAKCISTCSRPGVELGLRRCRVPRERLAQGCNRSGRAVPAPFLWSTAAAQSGSLRLASHCAQLSCHAVSGQYGHLHTCRGWRTPQSGTPSRESK